jgi:signal peptidase I
MNGFHWDYEVFLFIGLILTLGAWLFSKLKKLQNSENKYVQFMVTTGSFFPLLLLVLSVRSFAFEPFRIPSSSMMPTLLTGDFIYVNKSAYGVKMPVFHNTLIETGTPQRGDVFVFRSVDDPATDVIKRVIGVPGDHVRYDQRSKQVFINGQLIPEQFQGAYQGFHDDINPNGLKQKTAQTGQTEHTILHSNRVRRSFQFTDLVVPEGHYFGMGDNRDFSSDSRVWGLIPEKNIVGKAERIWMHWRPGAFIEGLKRIGTPL